MAKICIGSGKIFDVQRDRGFGILVHRNGKLVTHGTPYEMAVAEFKRIEEDAAYAAREAAMLRA